MTRTAPTTARSTGAIRLVQAGAALSTLGLVWQFATAGQLMPESGSAAAHGAGNMGAHVPGALVLTAGTVWLTVRAFGRQPVV